MKGQRELFRIVSEQLCIENICRNIRFSWQISTVECRLSEFLLTEMSSNATPPPPALSRAFSFFKQGNEGLGKGIKSRSRQPNSCLFYLHPISTRCCGPFLCTLRKGTFYWVTDFLENLIITFAILQSGSLRLELRWK